MLSEMRPKEIAEPVYAFSLPGRGLPFRADWMCRLLETRSRERRREAWFNRLEEWVIMPY